METATRTSWTYAQMREVLPPESRFEIHNYQLVDMSPAPSTKHQIILANLYDIFSDYTKLNQVAKTFFSPIDVVFSVGEVCQPDLVVVGNQQLNIIQENAIEGVPLLLVEVVSRGSVVRDYSEKKEIYERYGVPEYWIVDPRNETIMVYSLENISYKLSSFAEEAGQVVSTIFQGFSISIQDIFQSK